MKKTPPMLVQRLLCAVTLAAAVGPVFAAGNAATDASPHVQTRTPWTPPEVWYDVDPGKWTAADVERIRQQARTGDAQAEYFLGVLNEDGKLIPRNLPDALRYYKMSAESGNASAQASYARMLLNGWASPKKEADAIEWNTKAAAQNNRRALFNQGMFAQRNKISPGGETVALPLYEKAANLGLPQAALELAGIQWKKEPNSAQAWRWLDMATKTGFGPALLEFDVWCNSQPDGPECLTKVGNALEQAAKSGLPSAQLRYGVRLWDNDNADVVWNAKLRNHFIDVALDTPGLSNDKPEGARWFTRAAQAGNPKALFNVGLTLEEQNYRSQYYKPEYKVVPEQTIRTCFYHSAMAGTPDAMVALIRQYEQSEDESLSKEEREALAAYWTGKAGETGVFERNKMWELHVPGWRNHIGTPAPASLTKGIGDISQCAIEPLPGAKKDSS